MRKIIFFDVDGVLLDWSTGFLKLARETGRLTKDNCALYDDGVLQGGNGCWELTPLFVNEGSFWKTFHEFNESPAFDDLPLLVLPMHLEVLKNIGYELRVLSSVRGGLLKSRRAMSLTRKFGAMFDGIHYSSKKAEWLTQFIRDANARSCTECAVELVDDKPSTIEDCWRVGIPATFMHTKWNSAEVPSAPCEDMFNMAHNIEHFVAGKLAEL